VSSRLLCENPVLRDKNFRLVMSLALVSTALGGGGAAVTVAAQAAAAAVLVGGGLLAVDAWLRDGKWVAWAGRRRLLLKL